MRDEGVVLLGKPIDNSRVVRQVDPRSRREIWLLILLVAVLAAGLGLYAWPALEIRRAGQAGALLDRERERLVEENRKLRLEKAALENLARVERIASQELGLAAPVPERSVVIEVEKPLPPGATTVAGAGAPRREARTGGSAGGAALSQDRPPLVPPAMAGEGPTRRERKTRLRLMLLALTISLWALVIGIRLVHLQVLGRGFFEQQGTRQSERTINLDPRRGPILDREGRPLAVSVDAESLYAVPQDVADPRATVAALARALSLDAAERRELLAKLQKNRAFVWIQRKVDPFTARRVRELQLEGIGFLAEHRRYYPQRELAAHVLGYVGLDNTGMGGIEYGFEKDIRGRAAKVVVHTDARRRPVAQTERPSTDGATVVLALDEAIQHVAERELERSMAETQAAVGHGDRGRALLGRGAGHGRPPGLQPEPLQRLPRARGGGTARSPTSSSRAASSRSSPPPPGSRRTWWRPARCSTAATGRSRSRAPSSTTTRSSTSSPSPRRSRSRATSG